MNKKHVPAYQQLTDSKLSLSECRSILNKNCENYTDEQIIEIRDSLYQFALIQMEFFRNNLDADIK